MVTFTVPEPKTSPLAVQPPLTFDFLDAFKVQQPRVSSAVSFVSRASGSSGQPPVSATMSYKVFR